MFQFQTYPRLIGDCDEAKVGEGRRAPFNPRGHSFKPILG